MFLLVINGIFFLVKISAFAEFLSSLRLYPTEKFSNAGTFCAGGGKKRVMCPKRGVVNK